MSRLSVVVDDISDWADFYPSADVISLAQYLNDTVGQSSANKKSRRRVINLCREYHYLGTGYYCSLLAEARGERVLPSLQALGDFARKNEKAFVMPADYTDILAEVCPEGESFITQFYFGRHENTKLNKLGRQLFDTYGIPVLEVKFEKKRSWKIKSFDSISIKDLTDAQKTVFAKALDEFSGLLWRKPKKNWRPKFEMAILIDPQEKMPPSDKDALEKFVAAAKKHDIYAQFITKADYHRLAEFDALFIRVTTAVNHYTYKFARQAEQLGLVVIDDSTSILRCTNKIYLAKMFETLNLPAPKTMLLSSFEDINLDEVEKSLGFPLIMKIPDGAFSVGVHKIDEKKDFMKIATKLFKKSSFIITQAFCYTEYDWRIGVLGGHPIYACRYYMVKDHWAIYKHEGSTDFESSSGGFDAIPTHEVPAKVLKVAVDATKAIGNGLYGVDLKQRGDEVLLIEVNDNPSIDHQVEDAYLGDGLYDCVMYEFRQRLNALKRD